MQSVASICHIFIASPTVCAITVNDFRSPEEESLQFVNGSKLGEVARAAAELQLI
jgi:hypothetical protein